MLSSILGLNGVKIISKKRQKELGINSNYRCSETGNSCCLIISSEIEYCDVGRCVQGRYCLWY